MKKLNDLQSNRRNNIIEFLKTISNFDSQLDYKNKVPFVHIPVELLEQWHSLYYPRNKKWFMHAFSNYELHLIDNFNKVVHEIKEKLGANYPDVPDIFESNHWKRLADEASIVLDIW